MKNSNLISSETTATVSTIAGDEFYVDALGRIIIENPKILDQVKGAMGANLAEIPAPFWNGACSNQHC